jgi:hypothetical protein
MVFGYERTIKSVTSNKNNTVLQIIPREHNLNFHHRAERLSEQERRVPTSFAPQSSVGGRTSPWRNRMFGGGRRNIRPMMWMKIMDKPLI